MPGVAKKGSLKIDTLLSPLRDGPNPEFIQGQSQTDLQARAQAQRVFNALKAEISANSNKKIALLYSANKEQADQLHKAMKEGKPIPDIEGSGQALFFKHLIQLINGETDPTFKGKIQILPIATSKTGGENKPGNQVTTDDLNRDLIAIDEHIEQGYDVLGIQGKKGYGIGGGESKWFYDSGSNPINGKSQGDYVQEQLGLLERGQPLTLATGTSTPAIPTIEEVYSKLGDTPQRDQLKKIVDAYEEKANSSGEKNKVKVGMENEEPVIVFRFENAVSAEAFFRDQATNKIPFDMMFKGQDRRMYSDGTGTMVIGTKQDVDDYIVKKDNFTVDEQGNLQRKAATAGPAAPASGLTPPANTDADAAAAANPADLPPGLGHP